MIRRLAAALLLALLAGCSAVEFAYNNADTWLRWQAGSYLDLKNTQAEEFNARLGSFLAWHRSQALPQYARLAQDAGLRLERGATLQDLVWGYDAIRQQSREGLRRAGVELGDLLDRLSSAQIEHLERRFAENNRKYAREWLEGTPEERRGRRYQRLVHALEDWLGELSDAQRERVRQFNDGAPLNGELRDRERRRRQAELLAMLRARESARRYNERAPFSAELRDRDRKRRQAEFVAMLRAREAARRLARWAQDWEAGREPAYVEAARATHAEYVELLLDLDRTLSAEQRAHAVARLRRYGALFDSLARAQ